MEADTTYAWQIRFLIEIKTKIMGGHNIGILLKIPGDCFDFKLIHQNMADLDKPSEILLIRLACFTWDNHTA